jgi:hypothetical protein
MICVLDVLKGPASGRRFWVRQNQCMEIGRHSQADISIPDDTHLSRRHLLLDSTGNAFRVRDVGSSNGTFLNEKKVSVTELHSGDVIRAGLSVFKVSLLDGNANPHAEDGIHFGGASHGRQPDAGISVGTRTLGVAEFREEELGPRLPTEAESLVPSLGENEPTVRYDPKIAVSRPSPFSGTNASAPENVETPDPNWHNENAAPNVTPSKQANGPEKLSMERSPGTPISNSVRFQDELAWLSHFFSPTKQSRVYELTGQFRSPRGEFAGLLDAITDNNSIACVINISQLGHDAQGALSLFLSHRKAVQLSKTILFVPLESPSDLGSILSNFLGKDALICIGSPTPIAADSLATYANSLGFPSMFGKHLSEVGSPVRNYLLEQNAFALFEWDQQGCIGLLI